MSSGNLQCDRVVVVVVSKHGGGGGGGKPLRRSRSGCVAENNHEGTRRLNTKFLNRKAMQCARRICLTRKNCSFCCRGRRWRDWRGDGELSLQVWWFVSQWAMDCRRQLPSFVRSPDQLSRWPRRGYPARVRGYVPMPHFCGCVAGEKRRRFGPGGKKGA